MAIQPLRFAAECDLNALAIVIALNCKNNSTSSVNAKNIWITYNVIDDAHIDDETE